MLDRIETRRVDPDDPGVLPEHGPGSCREVLKTRTDGENDIRLRREMVGGIGAGHANSAAIERMLMQERRHAGYGFHDRNAMPFREFR